MNLYQRFLDASLKLRDDVVFDVPDGRAWSHGELHDLVARLAWRLAAAGVVADDRVMLQVEKSVEAVAVYLATLRLGAIHVPLNTAYTGAELEHFLADARPRVLICTPERSADLTPLATREDVAEVFTLGADGSGTLLDDVVAGAGKRARQTPDVCAREDSELAAILYTSGTTGRSKGAMLSHGNLAANADTLRQIWDWQADDVLLHVLPIYHVHGLFVALHCALLGGSRVLFHARFEAEAVLEALAETTVLMGVPTHYVRLLALPDADASRAPRVRLFISGSAPLLPETFAEFEARMGQPILERYGMTEAGMITSNPLAGPRVAGSVGMALPDVELKVCDEAGAEVSAGAIGTLQIRGPNVFSGYWRNPEKTAEEFRDGWFVTGDLVTCNEDGRVSIVGRARDLVISGGLNVYPREVESEIDDLAAIRESAVFGVLHPDFGEAVVAAVVLRSAPAATASEGVIEPVVEADVRAALEARLAGFKIPKRVLVVDELPRNAMGKVQKNLLRQRFAHLYQPD